MRHDGGCTVFIFGGWGGEDGEEPRESCEFDGSVGG